jgi:uncharacterized protein (DUF1501 family)
MTTGKFVTEGSYDISKNAPSVHSKTGLAAVVLGSKTGYRVYYHNANQSISEIGYTTADNWNYNGIISQDTQSSFAIHAAFSGKNNISVVTPRDSKNIEVTRYNSDSSWHISEQTIEAASSLS